MLDQLTSRGTLYAAFDRVRENGGCQGMDGVTLGQFHEYLEFEIDHLQDRLIRRRYHPLPLLQFQVPKGPAKLRTLSVPTVRDRVVQTAVHQLTRGIFEAEFEDCSYAFREGRSVKHAVHRIDELRRQGFRWIVDADIEGFFDNIDHEKLIARLRRLPLDPYLLSLFERWIRAEIYDGTRIIPLERGIPQGSVVSPVLANLFLERKDFSGGDPRSPGECSRNPTRRLAGEAPRDRGRRSGPLLPRTRQDGPAEMDFEGRNRRPPRDPLNALLSFGYVLVGQELQSLLDAMGFDPYLGVYHQVDYGRPSLALDLLEEFRAPLVDRLSATLLNTGALHRDDFVSTPEGGIQLRREALKRYFAFYQKELTSPLSIDGEQLTFRQLFRRQAERLAHAFLDNAQYEPFRLPC